VNEQVTREDYLSEGLQRVLHDLVGPAGVGRLAAAGITSTPAAMRAEWVRDVASYLRVLADDIEELAARYLPEDGSEAA
jgi:hypothetical protein